MSKVLNFMSVPQPAAYRVSDAKKPVRRGKAQVIIFPGVRIERHAPPLPAAKARAGSRKRAD